MELRTTTVIGLSGASGGLGTSTLAAAVARVASSLGHLTLLVDLASNGAGLDQLGGCAHEPGLRWPLREEGMLSLRSRHLPVWGGVRVLSQRGPVRHAPALGQEALRAVARLAQEHEVTVLDLPRPDHAGADRWAALCGTALMVAGTSPPLVAAALVARALMPAVDALVARPGQGDGLETQDVAQALGLPLLATLPRDASVPAAVVAQEWPGGVEGPLRDTASAVLAAASEAGRSAA
jgi:hypothetical protein